MGFPGGSDCKQSACKAGDLILIPESGRFPREGNGNPLQYSGLENSKDRGTWWATVHGAAVSHDWATFTFRKSTGIGLWADIQVTSSAWIRVCVRLRHWALSDSYEQTAISYSWESAPGKIKHKTSTYQSANSPLKWQVNPWLNEIFSGKSRITAFQIVHEVDGGEDHRVWSLCTTLYIYCNG